MSAIGMARPCSAAYRILRAALNEIVVRTIEKTGDLGAHSNLQGLWSRADAERNRGSRSGASER